MKPDWKEVFSVGGLWRARDGQDMEVYRTPDETFIMPISVRTKTGILLRYCVDGVFRSDGTRSDYDLKTCVSHPTHPEWAGKTVDEIFSARRSLDVSELSEEDVEAIAAAEVEHPVDRLGAAMDELRAAIKAAEQSGYRVEIGRAGGDIFLSVKIWGKK